MAFSPFDRRLLDEGLWFFSRPRLATLLEQLGADEEERLEALTTMLRHAAPDEFEEAAEIFERALSRTIREQTRARAEAERDLERQSERAEADRERRIRYSASAERRAQRRREA